MSFNDTFTLITGIAAFGLMFYAAYKINQHGPKIDTDKKHS